MKMTNTTTGTGFSNTSTTWRNSRDFRFSISYRFGTMKGSIKKVRRGISNDDVKSGGNSESTEQSM